MKTKTKLISLLCALAMLIAVFASCSGNVPNDKTPSNENENKEQAVGEATTYVSLDINPEISLTVDENGKVTGVFAENEDAQVLLYGEASLVGAELEAAVEKITELAVELGYLDEENKVVGVIVSNEDEAIVTEICNKIDQKVKKIAEKKSIAIETSREAAYSLMCDLEELKAQYPDDEEIQKLSLGKFKLARTAFEAGEMTVEEAVKMNEKALINRLDSAFNRIDHFVTKTYEETKKNAEIAYETAMAMALDGVYAQFYSENVMKYPNTYYYGVLYQLYTLTEMGYLEVARLLAEAEATENVALTEEQIGELALSLGIEDIDELKNSEGEITLESIEAFADKHIKNNRHDKELESFKNGFKEHFGKIENDVKAELDRINGEKDPAKEIENSTRLIINALETMGMILSPSAKAELEGYITEYQSIILTEEKLTAEAAEKIADTMKTKAEEMLAKINADLSDEDKAAIEELKTQLSGSMEEARTELEGKIKDAEKQAKEHLEKAKAERRGSRK